jgi:hypothetical protein
MFYRIVQSSAVQCLASALCRSSRADSITLAVYLIFGLLVYHSITPAHWHFGDDERNVIYTQLVLLTCMCSRRESTAGPKA